MKRRGLLVRKTLNAAIGVSAMLAAAAGVAFLIWIIYTVVSMGVKELNWSFLIEPTKPYGIPDGGIANAILGTIMITLGAVMIGVPAGLLGGVYLSEFSYNSRLGKTIRFSANVMMGIPSIIVGLFVYTLLVIPTGHFSGFAGAVSLAVIMFPVIIRTTEDMLSMAPNTLRESALALGVPRWKTTLVILFRYVRSGLITGILLAVARVSGETAPLLFTALWSDGWPTSFFSQPTPNLTVTINEYATNSPYEDLHIRAWGAALLITAAILALNIFCRTVFREKR